MSSPVVASRDTYILNVGREAHTFYLELHDFIVRVKNYQAEFRQLVDRVYMLVVEDLIRIMGQYPAVVVTELRSFPKIDGIPDLLNIIEYQDYDALMELCQKHALTIYLTLQPQIEAGNGIDYIPIQVGQDFIVARKIITTYVD